MPTISWVARLGRRKLKVTEIYKGTRWRDQERRLNQEVENTVKGKQEEDEGGKEGKEKEQN